MDSAVVKGDKVPLDFEFLLEVELKLLVDVLYDGSAAILFVDLVTETLRAHNHQPKTNIALLQLFGGRGEGGETKTKLRQDQGMTCTCSTMRVM